jgi:hypothetical protein
MRSVRVLAALGFVVGVLAVWPQPAPAANASKPRVPVVWGDVPCLQLVDVSQTPVLHLEYSVASEENAELTPDEVSDSRRHQFFAFAAQHFEAAPPTWITRADIDRAALVDPMVVPDGIAPDDVLETSSRWPADEWVRITADDMRVPITFAQAMLGVDWDLTAVSPGTWLVKGYTWEPIRNLWSTRWAAVKVIASEADAADAGPSVILLPDGGAIESGLPHALPGCVDAPAGSALTLAYGVLEGTLEPDWVKIETVEDVATGELVLDFVPPHELVGAQVQLRLTITDPDGHAYVAHSPESFTVIQGPETDEDDSGGCSVAGDRARLGGWLLPFVFASCWRRRRSR